MKKKIEPIYFHDIIIFNRILSNSQSDVLLLQKKNDNDYVMNMNQSDNRVGLENSFKG